MVHDWFEIHVCQDVFFEIDAWGHLNQFQAPRREAEDTAFGNIEHRLAAQTRIFATERSMFNFIEKFMRAAFSEDLQLAIGESDIQISCREGSAEHQALGILTD